MKVSALQRMDCKSIFQRALFDLKKKCCLKVKKIDNIYHSLAGVACSSEKKIFLEGLLARL